MEAHTILRIQVRSLDCFFWKAIKTRLPEDVVGHATELEGGRENYGGTCGSLRDKVTKLVSLVGANEVQEVSISEKL